MQLRKLSHDFCYFQHFVPGIQTQMLRFQAKPAFPFLVQNIIRKERAVGLIPGAPTIYEVLEELAITVQQQLVDAPLPFCAFNGGGDVFVDVGNKSLGLEALMQYLKFNPSQVQLPFTLSHCTLKSCKYVMCRDAHRGLMQCQQVQSTVAATKLVTWLSVHCLGTLYR